MDVSLHDLFAATLAVGSNKVAEVRLREVDAEPRFTLGVLELVTSPGVGPGVQRAAAVYLKNIIQRRWAEVLLEDVKREFRARIIAALPDAAAGSIRDLLLVCVQSMISSDLVNNAWPELVPQIATLLQTQHAETVHAGLSLLLQLCRYYRYQRLEDVTEGLVPVLGEMIPVVLSIGETCASVEDGPAPASMLYDVLKIIKFGTARLIPEVLQQPDNCARAVRLHLQVLARQASVGDKCQKWAVYNLLRIHERFLCAPKRSLQTDMARRYAPFRKMYLASFTPTIVHALLESLEEWSQGRRWLGPKTLRHIVAYLHQIVELKQTWPLLAAHVAGIVAGIIFPLLCATEDDVDLFEDEPVEFVQKSLEIWDDASPAQAASNFLLVLTKKRKETFPMVARFLEQQIQQAGQGERARAGCLRMFQTLVPVFKTEASAEVVQAFLGAWVVPDLGSTSGLLQFRACLAVQIAADLLVDRQILQTAYQGVLHCFFAGELPVQCVAALTFRALSTHEDVKAALGQHVTEIVRNLLLLVKKIDLEQLLQVLDQIVAQFPQQITPFAVELAEQLRDQFLQLASDIHESINDDLLLANEDKAAAGSGILSSLTSLQTSLEDHRELQIRLEDAVAPILVAVYQNELTDFFTETFELHENTLFSLKSVSPTEWSLFPLVLRAVEATALDYMEEAAPLLHNYILFGAGDIAMDREKLGLVVRLIIQTVRPPDPNSGTVDSASYALCIATRLLCAQELQNGPMHTVIPEILDIIFARMADDQHSRDRGEPRLMPPRYAVNLLSVVLAAIFNHPRLSADHIARCGLLDQVMAMLLQQASKFTKVGDLKLIEMATLSLLNQSDMGPFEKYIPQLLELLAGSLEALPAAIKRHEQLVQFEEEGLLDEDDEGWETAAWDDFDDDDDDENDDDQANDSVNNSAVTDTVQQAEAHIEATAQLSQQGQADASQATMPSEPSQPPESNLDFVFEDFTQDEYFGHEPLSLINPFEVLAAILSSLSTARPEHYQRLLSMMSDRTRTSIQDGVAKAASTTTV